MARRNKKGTPINGWVNVDKPEGMTSTQVVGKLRRLLNAQKLGHAGTLDPIATGILPIALGEATKTIPFVQDATKIYRFRITWGQARDTDDREGQVIATSDRHPTKDQIQRILPDFTGKITQIPPKFSAIKINGERAYDLARDGQSVEMPSRTVHIYRLSCFTTDKTGAEFETVCGKGTYVRALARDMAKKLGTYGYIETLRRTDVGNFSENQAFSLDKLEEMGHIAALEQALLPVDAALDDIPALMLTAEEANRIAHGQSVSLISRQDVARLSDAGIDPRSSQTALARVHDRPLALVTIDGVKVKPVRVFNV